MESPRSPALAGLFVLALLYTLALTADIVLPILVAALLALVLAPVVARLSRLRVPRAAAAGLVTAALFGGLAWGVGQLAEPAGQWLDRAPQSMREIERKLRPVREPVRQVVQATEQVERLAGTSADKRSAVTVKQFNLGEVFVISLTELATQTMIVAVLLFFLLASGDRMLRRAARVPATPAGRRRVIAVARRTRQDVSRYLGMIALVNVGLGMVTALVMWGLGVPNPALWGVVAAVLNFIPYAGAMVTALILAVVGLLSFDDIWRSLLPALAFLALTTLESDVVTPMVVGRRLTVPPVLVFLSLVLWGWLWGVAGALLAVPILVILKVAADNLPVLRPLAPFLGNGVTVTDHGPAGRETHNGPAGRGTDLMNRAAAPTLPADRKEGERA